VLFSTRRTRLALGATLLVSVAVLATCAWIFRTRVFFPDSSLDRLTTVAPSLIPGAGNGLFAAVDLEPDDMFAEMGGQLVVERFTKDRGYIFRVPDCGKADLWPYDAIDGTVYGGHGSKVNFAPSRINGVETHLQNARGVFVCERPYWVFKANQHIAKGTEIYASYGKEYTYDFMEYESVRKYFCDVTKIDCTQGFQFDP
jgi:hypothetical protein